MSTTLHFRYEAIADDLRQRIRSGEFGEGGRLPTELDLAERYEVNRQTLRKAVDLLADDGLVSRQRGRGTFVEQVPADPAAGLIHYVGGIHEHFWRDIYINLAKLIQADGGRVHVTEVVGREEPKIAPGEFSGRIIAEARLWPHLRQVFGLDRDQVVLVDFPTQWDPPMVPQVLADTQLAACMATNHLLERGHRRIAFLGFGSDPAPDGDYWLPFAGNLAYRGVQDAMRVAGVAWDGLAMGAYGGGEPLRRQLREFLRHCGEWPTAFVCQQDFKARDLLAVAAEQGVRVPEDVSIVSLGNTPWAEAMVPALTSIDLRPDEIARLAALLVQQPTIGEPTAFRVQPRIIERESVSEPRSNPIPTS